MALVDDPTRVYVGNLTWKGGLGFSLAATLAVAARRYWFFILLILLREAPVMLSRGFEASVLSAYKRMFRFHALVLLSILLFVIGSESFLGFALVLFILFAPSSLWRVLGQRVRPRDDPGEREEGPRIA